MTQPNEYISTHDRIGQVEKLVQQWLRPIHDHTVAMWEVQWCNYSEEMRTKITKALGDMFAARELALEANLASPVQQLLNEQIRSGDIAILYHTKLLNCAGLADKVKQLRG